MVWSLYTDNTSFSFITGKWCFDCDRKREGEERGGVCEMGAGGGGKRGCRCPVLFFRDSDRGRENILTAGSINKIHVLKQTFQVFKMSRRGGLQSGLNINPLMPKRYFVPLYKQILLAANTDLFNPLVPKAHNSCVNNLLFPLQIKPLKVNWS